MEKIKITVDKETNTLHVWFDDPETEFICEETGDEVIIIKNKDGKVIGFEKLNYQGSKDQKLPKIEAEFI